MTTAACQGLDTSPGASRDSAQLHQELAPSFMDATRQADLSLSQIRNRLVDDINRCRDVHG